MEVRNDVSHDVNDMDGVIEKNNYMEFSQDIITVINNMKCVIVKSNENIMIVKIYMDDIVF